jgi:hypothetical protein
MVSGCDVHVWGCGWGSAVWVNPQQAHSFYVFSCGKNEKKTEENRDKTKASESVKLSPRVNR